MLTESGNGWTLHCCDCLEWMAGQFSADALVTDPPYGMALGKHGGARDRRPRELRRGAYDVYDDTPENYKSVVAPAISLALSRVIRGAVFGPAPSIWTLPAPDALGAVYIPAANGRSPWGFQNLAPVLLYGCAPDLHKGARNTVFRSTGKADMALGHPCPKPVEWMQWLVDLASRHGELVCDPFAGSGTTGVACLRLGRRFVGCELSEDYWRVAVERLRAEENQTTVAAARAGQVALFGERDA